MPRCSNHWGWGWRRVGQAFAFGVEPAGGSIVVWTMFGELRAAGRWVWLYLLWIF